MKNGHRSGPTIGVRPPVLWGYGAVEKSSFLVQGVCYGVRVADIQVVDVNQRDFFGHVITVSACHAADHRFPTSQNVPKKWGVLTYRF